MELESIFIYLVAFSFTLALLGSGLFDAVLIQGESVSSLAPPPKCSDGTAYGKCSSTKPLYCSDGTLINNCTKCGCPTNQTCDTTTNYCFKNCTDGTLHTACSLTKPKYCYNGTLLDNCSTCGCPADQSCNATTNLCYTSLVVLNCSDGTPHNSCSSTKPLYCVNGSLINNCSYCGCPSGQSCNTTSNSCYSLIVTLNCSDGTAHASCSLTKPKYCWNGTLSDNCTGCGCPDDWSCNSTSNSCYLPTIYKNCTDGTTHGSCSLTKPKYCQNGTLVDNCTYCNCSSGQFCNVSSNACYLLTCSDGTVYNNCSLTRPKFCKNGTLVDNCSLCGCPSGQSCNATSNTCYVPMCSDGTLYNLCSVTRPKYCDNGTLIDKCSVCGCPSGLNCSNVSNSCYLPNNPPNVTTPLLRSTFGTNTTTEDLNCSASISDLDGDIMNVTTNWYRNDEITVSIMYKNVMSGSLTSVLKSANLSAGERWQCNMVVTDGKDSRTSNFSNHITLLSPPILNLPPDTPRPLLNSSDGSNTVTGNLNCYDTIMDPNGDRMNATVAWYMNGSLFIMADYKQLDSGSFFNAVLLAGNLSVGDSWGCRVRLYDGNNYSAWGVSNNLTIVAPPIPPAPPTPPSQPPAGGGAPPAPPTPPGGGENVTPVLPTPTCVNKLEVTAPEDIYIPQRVTKQVGVIIKNAGTCLVPSIAAALSLPLGMKANFFILDSGLDVNESQRIDLTVLPTDAPAGKYPATLKLDAPNISISKSTTVWLLENPSYVVSEEGPSMFRTFEYIILLILIEFVFGSAIILVWYGRPEKEEEFP